MPSEWRAAPRQGSELKARIASSIVLAPVALVAVMVGGFPFALVVILFALLALWEWTAVAGASDPAWVRISALLCLTAGLLGFAWSRRDLASGLLAAPALLALLAGFRSQGLFWTGLGILYVAVPSAALIVLRQADAGWTAVLFLLVVVWATDVGAYFGGRRIGGPKLWPRISPSKTWSGAAAGVAAAVIAGGAAASLTRAGSLAAALLLAAILSVASQAGDLLESAMKRHFGVKDSGRIIPGHGGILDRVDGLFAAAALAWLIAGLGLGGDILRLPGSDAPGGGPS